MAEVHLEVVAPVEELTNFTHCTGCGTRDYCRRHGCQKMNGRCDTIANPADFEGGLVLIAGSTPFLMGGCPGCPDWRVCIQFGCVKQKGGGKLLLPEQVTEVLVEAKICPQTQRT